MLYDPPEPFLPLLLLAPFRYAAAGEDDEDEGMKMDESAAGDALALLVSLTGDGRETLAVLLCRLTGVDTGIFSVSSLSLPFEGVATAGGGLLYGEELASIDRSCIRARLAWTTRTPPIPPLSPDAVRLGKNGEADFAGGDCTAFEPLAFADNVSAARL